MGIFSFLFSKKSKNQYQNKVQTVSPANKIKQNYDLPFSIEGLTDNHFEVLKRTTVYRLEKKPEGIINSFHKNVSVLVNRFIELGLLEKETIDDFLNRLTNDTLKDILRKRELKISGKKMELVERILSNVPKEDYAKMMDDNTYHISVLGKELLENYKQKQLQKEIAFQKNCVNLIIAKKVVAAHQLICDYKASQLVDGSLVDWEEERINGIPEGIVNAIITLLDFDDEETDHMLELNKVPFNAYCAFCYLSGMSLSNLKKYLPLISKLDSSVDFDQLYLRAHTITSSLFSLRDLINYRESGVKKYQVVCAYDNETCEKCGDIDSKVFYVRDSKMGVNCPPFHKACRCTTVPFDDSGGCDSKKVARDKNGKSIYIPCKMSFTEYKKRYLQ